MFCKDRAVHASHRIKRREEFDGCGPMWMENAETFETKKWAEKLTFTIKLWLKKLLWTQ